MFEQDLGDHILETKILPIFFTKMSVYVQLTRYPSRGTNKDCFIN